MAVVEDGEILELDKDEVIDLCSDGKPNPPLDYQAAPDVSPPPVNPSPLAMSHNPYTGGDPFLGPNQPQDDVHNPTVRFSRLRCSSALYRHMHFHSGSLSDVHSPLHSPVPPEKPVFGRDPYAGCSPAPSIIQESAPEALNMSTHSHALSSLPPGTSLSTLPTSHGLTWHRPAPLGVSPNAFRSQRDLPIPDPQQHDHDPERYAPNGNQPPLSRGSIYHAEPVPPPSFFYSRQHPSIPPMNADPSQKTFDVPRRRRTHTIPPPQEGSGALFAETYASTIANGHAFPASNSLKDLNGFSSTGISYRAIHEVRSPRARLANSEVQEEENVAHRGHIQDEDLNSLRNQVPYNQSYSASVHQGSLFGTGVERHQSGDADDGERSRRRETEARMSSLSDEEGQDGNSADCGKSRRERGNGRQTGQDEGENLSQPKVSLGTKKNMQSLSGHEVSDGEIPSSGIASPVMSLATVPDETPSPPASTKKKRANIDAKKHLSELRRKALMSVKKRPVAKSKDDSDGATLACPSPANAATSTSIETVAGPQNVQVTEARSRKNTDREEPMFASTDRPSPSSDEFAPEFRTALDSTVQVVLGGVRRTMTRKQFAEWQAWPYQNRVLVDYSSDSSNSDSGDASDDNDSGDDNIVKNAGEFRRCAHRNRESQIEAMKIRMIRLGKCPSMLFGGEKESTGSKESKKKGTSSSSILVGKPEEEPVPEKDDNTIVPNSAMGQEQGKTPAMLGHAGQGQQTGNSKSVSSVGEPNAAELNVCSIVKTKERSNSPLTSGHDREGKSSTRPLLESRNALQPVKTLENRSDVDNESARNNSMKEYKELPELQNGHADSIGGKEILIPLKASRSDAGASNGNSIADLKRRIAAIERTRDLLKQQRNKRQKTAANQEIRTEGGTKPDAENKNLSYVRAGETELPSTSHGLKLSKREPSVAQGENGAPQKRGRRGGKRYYSSGITDVVQSKPVVLAAQDNKNEDMDIDTKVKRSESGTSFEKQPSTGDKQGIETSFRLPDDNVERRYIDDLKLELEQKTKELLSERDRTERLRTAEIAIAEAQAKLNFTRSRVSALRDELQRAEQEVLDAEEECRQRARVVAQLHFANDDIPSEIASGPEGEIGNALFTDVVDSDVLSSTLDVTTETDREEDTGAGEEFESDFVLRPSPYSPSVGANFTSCLRALRAYASVTQLVSPARWDTKKGAAKPKRYIIRIPRHSKAKDRIAGGILSPTWAGDLDPMKAICPQELRGQCSNSACEFQHLKVFKAPKDRALQVIQMIEKFFSRDDKQMVKSIVNARIAIHEGKDATRTLFSLISTLHASSKTIPYSCEAD